MLDELTSCARIRISKPIFLLLAPLCYLVSYLVGFATESDQGQIFGLLAALVFVGLYFISRRQVLALTSAGDSIRIQTEGMSLDGVVAFIDAVEEAKNARYPKKEYS
ncbi:MAG: hypothetical protein ACT4NY_18985 [Pseudonocardiales bacterium]